MAEVERMSSMLLRLYAISLDRSAPDFLSSALGEFRRLLPFDSAWWGLFTACEGRFAIQASYVEGLPYEMDRLWLSIQEEDVIGHAVLAQPGRTLSFAPAMVERTPGSRWLARRTGFRHVLCTQMHNPITDQHAFLALSRHDDARFTPAERRFKEIFMQHLGASATINQATYLGHLRDGRDEPDRAAAVLDRAGNVHVQDARFARLVRQEWPNWRGPSVPEPLRRCLEGEKQVFQGERIGAAASSLGALVLVEVKPRSPLDDLTPRERAVAEAFAKGESYKEIARSLRMAPATVRHHLRSIYVKLNVSSKAQIVQVVCANGKSA